MVRGAGSSVQVKVGVDLALLEGELHVVGKGGVRPLHQGVQVGVARLHEGVGVAPVPEADPEPQGPVPDEEPQVGVAPLGPVPPGVERALPPLLPLPLEPLEGLAGEVPSLELFKPSSPSEHHLAGVFSPLPGGVQEGLGLQDGVVGVAGVEAEEGAEGAVLPFEFFPGFSFQEAVVGVAQGGGEPAREVQGSLPVFLRGEDQEGLDSGEGLRLLLRGKLVSFGLGLHSEPPVREYTGSRFSLCGNSLG